MSILRDLQSQFPDDTLFGDLGGCGPSTPRWTGCGAHAVLGVLGLPGVGGDA
jgi:hypothetical protein